MKIGCQLYNLGKSPLSTQAKFEVIKTVGYDAVELSGYTKGCYGGLSAGELRELVDRLGLEINGAHVQYGRFEDSMDQVIAYHKKAGIHWCGISRPMPYFPDGVSFLDIRERMATFPSTREEIDRIVEEVKRYAAQLREAGLDLYYHTHNHEHTSIDGGRRLIDRLIEETDVMLEIDICWATKAGALTPEQLNETIDRYKDRIMWLHLKGNDHNESCPLDQGQLDCGYYYRLAEKLGHEYTIVEDDAQLPDSITSIVRSRIAMRNF